jgi:hypothetical protein
LFFLLYPYIPKLMANQSTFINEEQYSKIGE